MRWIPAPWRGALSKPSSGRRLGAGSEDLVAGEEAQALAPLARRQWMLAAVLAVAVAIAGFGIASPLWVKSPQQLAAEAAPPSPSVLTASVEQRVVTRSVVLRGAIASRQVFQIAPSSGQDGSPPIVTGVRVRPGGTVEAGGVVLEVSGRPVVALPGRTPAYRDLRPGAEGADITQLQRALQDLGYPLGDADGRFGPATKNAVESFYEDRGYTALTTGEAGQAALRAAEDEVTQLERLVEDANDALEDAAAPEEREQARKEAERAEEDLNAARDRLVDLRERTGPMVPRSEVVFLPSFPARVHELSARVGTQPEGSLVSLASGPLVVEGRASPAQREMLEPGMPVEIVPEGGDPVSGEISSIGELQSGSDDGGASAPGHTVVVTPERPLDGALARRGARLTVQVASSGDEMLAVPISALFAASDGATYVVTRTSAGVEHTVTVAPELSGEGYVAVRPVNGDLRPGDLVVIGSDAGGSG